MSIDALSVDPAESKVQMTMVDRTRDRTARALRPVDASASPVLSPKRLSALATEILHLSHADTMAVRISHVAVGIARVALSRVRMQDNGDEIQIVLVGRFGQRRELWLAVNQIDPNDIQHIVRYFDRFAHELPGDPTPNTRRIPPRTYLPNTTWRQRTADAFESERHGAITALVAPVLDAGFGATAMVSVYAHTQVSADKRGLLAAGQETDAELVVTGWNTTNSANGWAGQAARDWTVLNPAAVAARAIHMTALSANPVAFEPGRYLTILDRPAAAQFIHPMGNAFDARSTFNGETPLYDPHTMKPRLGQRIMDTRISISSDPNDPEGGFLPFNDMAFPLRPMTWVDHGVHENLGYDVDFAASVGYAPANDATVAIRMNNVSGVTPTTVDEMIAGCKRGIYVNRFAFIESVGGDPTSGMLTGITNGGCFLVKDGKIDKAIKNLRFRESPWFALNRLEAIGTPERAPFGFSPWAGEWPIEPIVVPPLMIRDFNFNALADSV